MSETSDEVIKLNKIADCYPEGFFILGRQNGKIECRLFNPEANVALHEIAEFFYQAGGTNVHLHVVDKKGTKST